jgi:DNA primase
MKFLNPSELKYMGQRSKDIAKYNCPFCIERRGSPDSGGHLRINMSLGIYHCFKCDASMRTTGIFLRLTSFKPSSKKEVLTKKAVKLPQDFYPLLESKDDFFPIFKEYGRQRKLKTSEVLKYKIGFTADLSDPMFGRLIFPHYDEETDKLDFIQGRTVFEDDEGPRYYSLGDKPLFKSFTGSVNSGVLVEGIFDVIKASRVVPSAALFGHTISLKQKEQIHESFSKRIVIALDADASESIIFCMEQIKDREIIPILLRKKDVDEFNESDLKSLGERVYQ